MTDAPKLFIPGSTGEYERSSGDRQGQYVQTHNRLIVGQWRVCYARQYNEGSFEPDIPDDPTPHTALEIDCEGTQHLSIANLGVFTEDDPAWSDEEVEGGRLHLYPNYDGFSWGATKGRDAPQIVLEVGELWSGALHTDRIYLRATQPTAYKLTCTGLPYELR